MVRFPASRSEAVAYSLTMVLPTEPPCSHGTQGEMPGSAGVLGGLLYSISRVTVLGSKRFQWYSSLSLDAYRPTVMLDQPLDAASWTAPVALNSRFPAAHSARPLAALTVSSLLRRSGW